jgi:predicted permease
MDEKPLNPYESPAVGASLSSAKTRRQWPPVVWIALGAGCISPLVFWFAGIAWQLYQEGVVAFAVNVFTAAAFVVMSGAGVLLILKGLRESDPERIS